MESGRPFVDRYALVVDPANPHQIRAEFRHADGIHITRTGQARIAEEATKVFRKIGQPVNASSINRTSHSSRAICHENH